MKKTLELTLQQARDIYKTADASLKEILEANFGKKNLVGRPLGVWCLTTDKKAVKPDDWDSNRHKPMGVGVITEKTSFIVLPAPQAALPFGSTDVEKYDDIVYDEETYDNAAATDCIDTAHQDIEGFVYEDKRFPFVGAPSAEYCVQQGGALPTLATAKEIASNIGAINEAMRTIGGAVVCGWLWTSTVKKSNNCAFVVSAINGSVYFEHRYNCHTARAVSAFHFEDFDF
jgi:hypothetical protein